MLLTALIITIIVIIIIVLLIALIYFEIPRYFSVCRATKGDVCQLDSTYWCKPRVDCCDRVVVSLTTIPDRIDKMTSTLYSILAQTRRVDEIQINLPFTSLKGIEYQVPEWLNDLKHIKVRRVTEDWGPSCKLLPTAQVEPDSCIIVIDDDIIYGSSFIECIVDTFTRYNGKLAVTNYGYKFGLDRNSNIGRYILGDRSTDIMFGCGGYILKGSMLPPEAFDYSPAPKEVVYVDDGWISGWLTVNNVEIHMMGSKWGGGFLPSMDCFGTISLSGDYNDDGHNSVVINKWFRDKGIWSNSG